MMKGYLTVFLSLSLSLLTGFVLLLTGNAVKNAWKVRLEGAADLGMNSVLGEYQIELHDRYGLLYIDTSYNGREPSLSNMEDRLTFYISQNLQKEEKGPFGKAVLMQVNVENAVSAAAGNGSSMKYQAVQYAEDCRLKNSNADSSAYLEQIAVLDAQDAAQEWSALMEQIAGMELPQILNEKGEWEEVPLSNPADGIFSLLGSDVLYLADIDFDQVSMFQIRKEDYISGRVQDNMGFEEMNGGREADTDQFLVYLFETMGNYRGVRQDSLLRFQLEYIVGGEASDYENLKAVTEQLFSWRFAANANEVFRNGGFYQEALEAARMLHAVQLQEAFEEPVARSILYACAFLEAIGDVKCLLNGGRVELHKSHFRTGISQVLSGTVLPAENAGEGLCYEQYLSGMLHLLSEDTRNMRTMDLMEMDVRKLSGNRYFCMDFCVERYTARITAAGSMGSKYELVRRYGYY